MIAAQQTSTDFTASRVARLKLRDILQWNNLVNHVNTRPGLVVFVVILLRHLLARMNVYWEVLVKLPASKKKLNERTIVRNKFTAWHGSAPTAQARPNCTLIGFDIDLRRAEFR